ncbi:Uncharacterised protein [uncultured Clostridium sp.]|nr:Uncharacterised protein [uncultured Clostridium sp.]SCJ50056.1 Uncharacterised protein [uncultured Clostridium sp.]
MSWFYNNSYFTTKFEKTKNEIGQVIKGYTRDSKFACDLQPIDERSYKYTWGEDIKSNIQMFCDENLSVKDIIILNEKVFEIEKKVHWDDYNIYALLESDVIVN